MKTKKFAVIMVAIVFVLVMLVSSIALFSVKKIEVDFSVGKNTDTAEAQAKLDEFLGENLMFLDTEELVNSISNLHYMEVVSVEKSYPNVVSVQIKERREIYDVVSGENVFVTTDDGLVLRTLNIADYEHSRERIKVNLTNIEVKEYKLGKTLVTSADEILLKIFEMAKSVELTNCIKEITVDNSNSELPTAEFQTYTGVKIYLPQVFEMGVERTEKAFKVCYESEITDYYKTVGYIMAIPNEKAEGGVQAWWTLYPDGTNKATN